MKKHKPVTRRRLALDELRGWSTGRYASILWLALALLSYRGVLEFFFVQDDFWFLEAVQKPIPNLGMLTGALPDYLRPVPTYWFTLVNQQLWGLNPFGFHLTQFLFFLLTVFFLYDLLYLVSKSALSASAGTAVFVLSKVHLYTLGWFSGSIDVLAGFFFVFTLWAALRYEEGRAPLVLVIGSYVLALLSKESTAVLPVALAGYVLATSFQERKWPGVNNKKLLILMAGVSVLYLAAWAAWTLPTSPPEQVWGFDLFRSINVLQSSVTGAIPSMQHVANASLGWIWFPVLASFILLFLLALRFQLVPYFILALLLWLLPAVIFSFTKKPASLQLYHAHFSLYGLALLTALVVSAILRRTALWRIKGHLQVLLLIGLVSYTGFSFDAVTRGIKEFRSPSLFGAQYSFAAYDQIRTLITLQPYQEIVFLNTSDPMWWSIGKGTMIPVMFQGVTASFDGKDGYRAPLGIRTDSEVLVL